MTDLDRGVLARIDRKLLAGLDQDETWRMVRIPVAAANWSTWKRYCDSAGISMGRAIVTLIDRELISVFGDQTRNRASVFAEQAEEELASRQTDVARREQAVAATEERLKRWSEHLRSREDEVEAREMRIETRSKLSAGPENTLVKVGRNDRVPMRVSGQVQALPRPARRQEPPPTRMKKRRVPDPLGGR